jgi:hypothetical protein
VLAEGLLRRFPASEADRTREAYRALIGRGPDETEARILARLFAEQSDLFARNPDDAGRFLGVGDSAFDRTLPQAELAAMTTVVSAIRNLEEFVVVR